MCALLQLQNKTLKIETIKKKKKYYNWYKSICKSDSHFVSFWLTLVVVAQKYFITVCLFKNCFLLRSVMVISSCTVNSGAQRAEGMQIGTEEMERGEGNSAVINFIQFYLWNIFWELLKFKSHFCVYNRKWKYTLLKITNLLWF